MIDDPARIETIEASARAALPAIAEQAVDGWLCRMSGGTTKRVNSANPVRADAALAAVRSTAERCYRAAGLPVRFRLTPLAERGCDAALAVAGYRHVEPSLTMVAPLRPHVIDPAVTIAPRAEAGWHAGLATASGWSHEEDVAHRALMTRLPAGSAVAVLDQGDGPLAYGTAGLGAGRVCLFNIVVLAATRGQGVGRRLVASLLGWAAAAGHGEALLQVTTDNAPARRLYETLGFVDAYPYHYRIAD